MNLINFFQVVINPIFSNQIIFLFVFFIFIIIFLSIKNRITNSSNRIIILLLFLIIIIQPSIKIEKRKIQKNVLTFVLDKTDSQKLASRTELNNNIYKNILQQIEKEKEFFNILEITIDNNKYSKRFGSVDEIRNSKIKSQDFYHKNKSTTKMLDYVKSEINKFPVKRISSIFFFTDGQIHDSKDEWFKKQFNIPSYFIIPSLNFFSDSRIDVENYPEYVEVGEEIEIKAKASFFGREKNQDLFLTIFGSNGKVERIKMKVNETKNINLNIDKPGDNFYVFNLTPSDEEASIFNNQKLVRINASRKKLKVLLISGEPYLGTRVWRNFLKSDPAVELIHMTVLRPPEKIDNTDMRNLSLIPFPVKELFEEKIDKFNLVIFDNFKGKNILTPLYFQNLVRFVEEGGGILEITGPSYNSRSSLFRTEIGRILPGIPSQKSLRGGFKPRLTELGENHPITQKLFEGYENYGEWYEMNKVMIDSEDTSILMTGINNQPLLSIKKINNGRIAQIYSHHIWLWRNISSEKGPYKRLIKNLAHWLMKEPKLEEDKLEISSDDQFIYIEKKNFKDSKITNSNIIIINPDGKKNKLKLTKVDNKNRTGKFKFDKKGHYLILNESLVKNTMTPEFDSLELTNIHINENFLNKIQVSGPLTKIIKTNGGNDLNFKKIDSLQFENKNQSKTLFLPFNYEFKVNETRKIDLYNRTILSLLILIFLIYTWKKESEKKGLDRKPNP